MFFSPILNLLLIILIVMFIWSRRKFYLLSWKLPGPIGYPLLGSALGFRYKNKILNYMLELRERYGSVFFIFLGLTPILIVSEPDTTEKLLSSNLFVNKSFIYNCVRKAIGDGLFTSANPKWSIHRKLINPSFNHKVLVSFFPTFNHQVKILLFHLDKKVNKGPIDIQRMLQKCTLDTTCQTTMGKEMNFQSSENTDIFEYFECGIKLAAERIFMPLYINDFIYQFFPSKKIFDETTKQVRSFVCNLIEQRQPKNDLIKNNNNDDDDVNITKSQNIFLDQAIKLRTSNDFTTDDVLAESITMVVAAYETTANVVYTTLLCLSMFPEYQMLVFEELMTIFPEKDFEVTYEHCQQLIYLEMVINEAMRVLSPVPLIARSCSKDFDLGNGVTLPEDTQILIDIFHMQRDEKYWGPKANTFYPDHFLKENFSKMHPYSFIPFTKGVRNCIGWRYGLFSMKIFLAQILRKFRFSTTFKFENLKLVEDIVLKFEVTPLLEVHNR